MVFCGRMRGRRNEQTNEGQEDNDRTRKRNDRESNQRKVSERNELFRWKSPQEEWILLEIVKIEENTVVRHIALRGRALHCLLERNRLMTIECTHTNTHTHEYRYRCRVANFPNFTGKENEDFPCEFSSIKRTFPGRDDDRLIVSHAA